MRIFSESLMSVIREGDIVVTAAGPAEVVTRLWDGFAALVVTPVSPASLLPYDRDDRLTVQTYEVDSFLVPGDTSDKSGVRAGMVGHEFDYRAAAAAYRSRLETRFAG